MTKLTPAQLSRLSYMAKPHVGGYSNINSGRDLRIFLQLEELGLVAISESRVGFYAAHLTDAGLALLKAHSLPESTR